MKNFIISKNQTKYLEKSGSIVFWFLIWHISSLIVKQEMLLPSPVLVLKELILLLQSTEFLKTVLFSFSRVVCGFFIALTVGIIFAVLSYRFYFINILLRPLINTVKATPVASYVILCLLFLKSSNLSICIAFLMVFPIIYTNVLEGLFDTDKNILEMAYVFKISPLKKALYIYTLQVLPFLTSACSIALGMSWKSAIAAELIGLPLGSIGEKLYQSKISFDTKTVLAWTIVIVLISFVFEKVFMFLLEKFKTYRW